MNNLFCMRSKLLDDNNFVLLAWASGHGSALSPVQVSEVGPQATPQPSMNWFGQGDPSGLFLIASGLKNSLVLNIKGATESEPHPTGSAALLNINTPEPGWHQNQLWHLSPGPEAPYVFVESALTAPNGQPFVLNIRGAWSESNRPPDLQPLDVAPRSGADSELWQIIVPVGPNEKLPPGNVYDSKVTLTFEPPNFVEIAGTGFAPGWLFVGKVTIWSQTVGTITEGLQQAASTIVNFDGTFQTAVVMMSPWGEAPTVHLDIVLTDSLGIQYQINATVSDNGQIQQVTHGRQSPLP